MTKRGISLHWTISDKIGELAQEQHTSWNAMASALIELGIPVFEKIGSSSPVLARSLAAKRYTYRIRQPALDRIQIIVDKEARKVRLDDRIAAALPRPAKEAIRLEARRRGRKMSQILREKIGVKF